MEKDPATPNPLPPPLKVGITGGTGFIGQALIAHLASRGHDVTCLSRDPDRAAATLPPGVRAARLPQDESSTLMEADALVHLAGAPAVGQRLTAKKKKEIYESRVLTTRALVRALAAMPKRPSTFVCASGVGFYGDRAPDEAVDETAAPGEDFLARLCVDWEKAAQEAEGLGVRVLRARFGVIFGPGGGLSVMALPFRFFFGGPLASGKQMMPWMDLRDCVRALTFLLENPVPSGAFNFASPEAKDNRAISAAVGRALGRPSYLPVPGFALKALFGEGAAPLITGQRAVPSALLDAGFAFEHKDLDQSLRDHLG